MDPVETAKQVLMDHYRHPRNRGDLRGMDAIRRGHNPRCGDEVEVGVSFNADRVTRVLFRARGCSICIASASMMTEVATGKSVDEIAATSKGLRQWFDTGGDEPDVPLPPPLAALSAVRHQSARTRCVLLPWDALDDALEQP